MNFCPLQYALHDKLEEVACLNIELSENLLGWFREEPFWYESHNIDLFSYYEKVVTKFK